MSSRLFLRAARYGLAGDFRAGRDLLLAAQAYMMGAAKIEAHHEELYSFVFEAQSLMGSLQKCLGAGQGKRKVDLDDESANVRRESDRVLHHVHGSSFLLGPRLLPSFFCCRL